MGLTIRPLEPQDWQAVLDTFLEGVATGDATFETEAPGWEEWDRGHLRCARLVAAIGPRVVGWAALSPFSHRAAYAGVAEVSVYVAASERGHGVGKALLRAITVESEANGIWTLQAGIFPENAASLALHLGCGFCVVGRRRRLGRLRGAWRDVVLMERRSPTVGCD